MRSIFGYKRNRIRLLLVALLAGALGIAIPVFANLPNSSFDANDGIALIGKFR